MNRFFIRPVLSVLLLLPYAMPAIASEGSCYGYLNLADSYWAVNDKDRAEAAYKQYASRMFEAGKPLKIPSRVGERSVGVPRS